MNMLMTLENKETPKMNMIVQAILSKSLLGAKSPNPTVDKDVNEK